MHSWIIGVVARVRDRKRRLEYKDMDTNTFSWRQLKQILSYCRGRNLFREVLKELIKRLKWFRNCMT